MQKTERAATNSIAIDSGTAGEGSRPPYWLLITLIGSLPVIGLFAGDAVDFDGWMIGTGHLWGRDFVNLWTGGNLLFDGKIDVIYSLREYGDYQRQLAGPLDPHFYSYPPSSIFLAALFGGLPYYLSLMLWIGGTAAIFLWAAKPYVKEVPGFSLLLAILTPAATVNIWAGHYGFLAGALWLACFSRIENAPARSGIFAALLTIKPHLGLLIPPLLLARRAWRTILVAALGSILLVIASGAAFGFELWHEYLTKVSRFQASLIDDDSSFYLAMMPGPYTSIRYSMGGGFMAWYAQALFAAAAIFLCWSAVRNGTKPRDLSFIVATATFLILPYAFNYDMTVASLGFALILFRQWHVLSAPERAALIAGYISPQMTFLANPAGVPLAPIALLIALLVQVRVCSPKDRLFAPDNYKDRWQPA